MRSLVRSLRFGTARWITLLLLLALCTPALLAATVDSIEDWDSIGNTEGWQSTSGVLTILNTDQDLRLQFGAPTGPALEQQAVAYADINASGAVFTGNYSNDAITCVSFDLLADTHVPSAARLQFYNPASGRTWHILLPDPVVGAWKSYTVPLTYKVILENTAREWQADTGGTEADFFDDLQNVEWIGIYLRRNTSTMEQIYHVDNFVLGGTYFPDPRHVDTDGDSHTDWEEYVAGTDPDDETSYLQLRITRRPDSLPGARLYWDSVSNRTYSILRAETLTMDSGTNNFSLTYTDISATPPRNVQDDGGGLDPNDGYFYYLLRVRMD